MDVKIRSVALGAGGGCAVACTLAAAVALELLSKQFRPRVKVYPPHTAPAARDLCDEDFDV